VRTTAHVRRLQGEDLGALRQIRLEGLRLEPTAFGSSYDEEVAWGDAVWQRWLDGNPPFGAFAGDALAGIVSFSRGTAANLRHRGTLGAMYVRPEFRRSGVGAQLVEALLSHATEVVEQVHLSVTLDNAAAIRFYRRLGFVEYGREPRGLKRSGSYFDVLLMVRHLDAVP
jgi:ribosomal protein S18 acetylase RimI-like enzyme